MDVEPGNTSDETPPQLPTLPGFGSPQEGPLHLSQLSAGMHGLTPAYGQMLSEAAAVCLDGQGHASGVTMEIAGVVSAVISVEWVCSTDQQRRNWADPQDATEFGAYGCAILVSKCITGLQVTGQSRKGTGFDWWLGVESDDSELFQQKARLEVSGIRKGSEGDIAGRVRQKLGQTEQSDLAVALPAWVVVVEFSQPHARTAKR